MTNMKFSVLFLTVLASTVAAQVNDEPEECLNQCMEQYSDINDVVSELYNSEIGVPFLTNAKKVLGPRSANCPDIEGLSICIDKSCNGADISLEPLAALEQYKFVCDSGEGSTLYNEMVNCMKRNNYPSIDFELCLNCDGAGCSKNHYFMLRDGQLAQIRNNNKNKWPKILDDACASAICLKKTTHVPGRESCIKEINAFQGIWYKVIKKTTELFFQLTKETSQGSCSELLQEKEDNSGLNGGNNSETTASGGNNSTPDQKKPISSGSNTGGGDPPFGK